MKERDEKYEKKESTGKKMKKNKDKKSGME